MVNTCFLSFFLFDKSSFNLFFLPFFYLYILDWLLETHVDHKQFIGAFTYENPLPIMTISNICSFYFKLCNIGLHHHFLSLAPSSYSV